MSSLDAKKQDILKELQQHFRGKQVWFTGGSSTMISLADMIYDGENWFCITGRAIVDIQNPKMAKLKHELTVNLNEVFESHITVEEEEPTDRFAMGTPGVAHADKDSD